MSERAEVTDATGRGYDPSDVISTIETIASTDPPKVISAGHINWDVTMRVARLPEVGGETRIDRLDGSGGGSAANVAAGLVALDGHAVLFGCVGGDDNGALTLRELASAGVDVSQVHIAAEAPTSVKYVIVDGDGRLMMLANDGANESFTAADLDEDVLTAADHLHLTSQRPQTAASLAEAAAAADATRSFDPGRRVGDRVFDNVVRNTDVLFINAREADSIAETTTIDPWNPTDRVVVITLGGDGATVRTPLGDISHAGFDIDPVDTTGAGDAFTAGFLAAALRGSTGSTSAHTAGVSFDPRDYEVPLLVGNVCGALTAEATTARTDLSWGRIADGIGGFSPVDLLVDVRI